MNSNMLMTVFTENCIGNIKLSSVGMTNKPEVKTFSNSGLVDYKPVNLSPKSESSMLPAHQRCNL